jgi:hypothetical protein
VEKNKGKCGEGMGDGDGRREREGERERLQAEPSGGKMVRVLVTYGAVANVTAFIPPPTFIPTLSLAESNLKLSFHASAPVPVGCFGK